MRRDAAQTSDLRDKLVTSDTSAQPTFMTSPESTPGANGASNGGSPGNGQSDMPFASEFTTQAPPQAQSQPTAPPFYRRPEPVLPATHRDMKIRPEFDFSFATNINTVPITVPEFTLASRHYPIMFLGPDLVPTVALGFNPQVNLFVDNNGTWAMGQYIPAYIRRYPFILLGTENDTQLHLGIDTGATSFKDGARALFEDGKESPALTNAITMCEQFHGAYMFTRDFSKALQDAGVVENRTLEIEVAPGRKVSVGSFGRITEEKFKQLSDATVLDWFKKGYLYAAYFHLQSMNNWDLLLQRNALLAAQAQATQQAQQAATAFA